MPTTRFYAGPDSSSPLGSSYAMHPVWFAPVSSAVHRRKLQTTPAATSGGGVAARPTTRPNSNPALQLVSDPIGAGAGQLNLPTGVELRGTFRGVGAAAFIGTARVHLVVRVVSGDGTVQRGVLVNNSNAGPIPDSSTPTPTTFAGALTPVVAQPGDRLVVEWGAYFTATGLGGSATLKATESTGTTQDLPYATTTSTSQNSTHRGWIELILDDPPQPPTGLQVDAVTATSATVSWTAPATGPAPTGYQVRIDGGAAVDVAGTSTLFEGLLPSSTHTVEVRTVTAAGPSSWTAPLGFTTSEPADFRPWLVSDVLLARAGRDPAADQPAFLWLAHSPGDVQPVTPDVTRSRSLMSWTITTGRTGARDRVPPTVATVTLAAWGEFSGQPLPQLGERFRLALSPLLTALGIDPADLPRFTGEVTDVQLDTRRRVVTVTGVGQLARVGRQLVDATSRPVEREGARVAWMLDRVSSLQRGVVDPGRVDLAAPDQPAALQQLVDQVSDSTLGQLVERRDGLVDWQSVERRRSVPATLALDAGELLAGFTWAQRVGDLTNQVTVSYAGGTESAVDQDSDVIRGSYPQQLDTLLVVPTHAQAIAGLVVGRYGRPTWILPTVAVDLVRTIAPEDLGAAVSLDHSSRVQLDGLPAGGPYTSRAVFVEGVTETLTPRSWQLQLVVADEQLSGAPIRWRDVPAGDRWVDVPSGLRWLDVARYTDADELTPST